MNTLSDALDRAQLKPKLTVRTVLSTVALLARQQTQQRSRLADQGKVQ
jgi:hypothetical protein